MNFNLNEQEKIFIIEYLKSGNKSMSWKTAYPGKNVGKETDAADRMLQKAHVKQFMDFMNLSSEEMALSILKEQMVFGEGKDRLAAAKEQFKVLEKEGVKDATLRWLEIANEIGAKVTIPPHTDVRELDFGSFLNGEALLELPLVQSSRSVGGLEPPGTTKIRTRISRNFKKRS